MRCQELLAGFLDASMAPAPTISTMGVGFTSGRLRRSSVVSRETAKTANAGTTFDRSARTRVAVRPPVFKTVYASEPLNTHVHHRVLLQQVTAIPSCPSVALVRVGFPWSRHNHGTMARVGAKLKHGFAPFLHPFLHTTLHTPGAGRDNGGAGLSQASLYRPRGEVVEYRVAV